MKYRILLGLAIFLSLSFEGFTQKGRFSGDLQMNTNFFQRDSTIGASGTPQYDNQLSGTEAWVNLNYSNYGFDIGVRFDAFLNSNLPDPNKSFNALGIGRWSVKKTVQNLGITAGHIYDQIGTGIIFRAYEERPLAIDNALYGLRLDYDLSENWRFRVFGGKQKDEYNESNPFSIYQSVIKGAALEGFYSPNDTSNWSLAPGIGFINRTLDQVSIDNITSRIATFPDESKFNPVYNNYAVSIWNTLRLSNFSLYLEGAFKSKETIALPSGFFVNRSGSVLYASASYSVKGLGITLQGKRTQDFQMRTSPNEILNRGVLNFIPPMARQNTYRLTARYNAVTQEIGEFAQMLDIQKKLGKRFSVLLNLSNITDLDNEPLYREVYLEGTFKKRRKWTLIGGVQVQEYNQEVYEVKPGVEMVQTITPFVEYVYKINRKKSLRTELQYMATEQDLGSWAYGLIEYNMAPKWSFSISDMVNVVPKKSDDIEHFYSLLVGYTHKANSFKLSYVKQVEGIVCTGGVCRFEPAFNGVRLGVQSRF